MGKICLFEAGEFLLGLDTSHIISIFKLDNLKTEKTNKVGSIFHLESFFVQKHLSIAGSEVIVLKNKKNSKYLALLINKTVGEIKLPDRFEPYPMIYPKLAIKCCPKIFLHDEKIVLMLDPKQLSSIHKELQTDHGLITLNDLIPDEKKIKQEKTPKPDSSKANTSKNKNPQPKTQSKINDQTIRAITAWTFDRYNEFYSNEKVINFYSNEKLSISTDELPFGLIQQKGLSNESLQQLIAKAILKCEEMRYRTMKNMIKDKLNEIL